MIGDYSIEILNILKYKRGVDKRNHYLGFRVFNEFTYSREKVKKYRLIHCKIINQALYPYIRCADESKPLIFVTSRRNNTVQNSK